MSFHVGQEVVCIKRDAWIGNTSDTPPLRHAPEYGHVYIVAGKISDSDDIWLQLKGFDERDLFHQKHFRPVVKRKTDISIFKKLLEPSTRKVKEPV